jgi:diamine N-acetyltransferase
MSGSQHSQSLDAAIIRSLGVEDVELLRGLSIETYTDTFDGTSSDEDMQKFLESAYSETVLREELANPESMFFLLSFPESGENGDGDEDREGGEKGENGQCGQNAEIPAGYLKLNFGDAQIEDMGPGAMEIQRLYIRAGFKGRGLGSQLMDLALQMARENGLHKVWLGVWEHNEPAKRFYAGKGFERVGEHVFWQGDDKQTDYLMAREV